MTFDEFISQTKGKSIGVTHVGSNVEEFTGECVSLVQIGNRDVYGVPLKRRGDAKYYGDNIIKNGYGYLVSTAEKGDLLVYDYLGGGYGHVAFYIDSKTIYDQNNGYVKPTRTAQFRPNNLGKPTQIIRMYKKGGDDLLKNYEEGDKLALSTEYKSHHENDIIATGTKEKPLIRYVIHKYPLDHNKLALSKTKGGKQSGATRPVNVYAKLYDDVKPIEDKNAIAIEEIKEVINKYGL